MSPSSSSQPVLPSLSLAESGLEERAILGHLLNRRTQGWALFYSAYERHISGAIYRVRCRFPGLLGAEDVDDIQANLAYHLLRDDMRKLRQFDPTRGTRFESWLKSVARNCAFDFLRQKRRQPHLAWAEDEGDRYDAPRDESPDAHRVVTAKQELALVREVVGDLSARDREFIALFYEQGLDPMETAERLGVQVSTVYSKKHKIRARIEGLLEKRLAA